VDCFFSKTDWSDFVSQHSISFVAGTGVGGSAPPLFFVQTPQSKEVKVNIKKRFISIYKILRLILFIK
jgi:hypothetical protein